MAKNVFRQGKKSISISQSGAMNIKCGKVKLSGARLEVRLESGRALHPLRSALLSAPMPNNYLPGGGSRVCVISQQGGLEITTHFILPADGPFIGLSVQVRNFQGATIPLQRVTLIKIPLRKVLPMGAAPKPYMLVESEDSSTQIGLHALSGEPNVDEIETDASVNMTALFVPGGECLFAGCLFGGRSVNTLGIAGDRFVVNADFNGEIPPHGCFETDMLLLNGFDNLGDAMLQFSVMNPGRRRAVEASDYHAWTSTNWYQKGLAESDIMDNLEFLKKNTWCRDKVKYVVVGHGWEQALGDWSPNDHFPSSMDALASRIQSESFTPGIWVAPLAAAVDSQLCEAHPDWLLKRTAKTQKPDAIKCLDFTLPEVRDFVYQLMRKLHDWGYRYFRTDFSVCEGALDTYRYRGDRGCSVMDHLRSLMTTIRAALGRDAFWVADKVPLSAVSGLSDAVGISGETEPFYSSLLDNARTGMFRSLFHGQTWLAEPGLLTVRGADQCLADGLVPEEKSSGAYARYEKRTGNTLSMTEAQLWASWLIVSGGVLTLGDRLASLNTKGRNIIEKALLRAGGRAAKPLDFGVVPLSRVWYRTEGQTALLALFNWSEAPQEIVVPATQGLTLPPDGEIYEVWSEETLNLGQDKSIRRTIPPHTCELFEWDF